MRRRVLICRASQNAASTKRNIPGQDAVATAGSSQHPLTARRNRDSSPRREGSGRIFCIPRPGFRHVTLNHVDQVSTRRGRACMDTDGCILASEQLFRSHSSMEAGVRLRKLLRKKSEKSERGGERSAGMQSCLTIPALASDRPSA